MWLNYNMYFYIFKSMKCWEYCFGDE
jgi:hypothetical protein